MVDAPWTLDMEFLTKHKIGIVLAVIYDMKHLKTSFRINIPGDMSICVNICEGCKITKKYMSI